MESSSHVSIFLIAILGLIASTSACRTTLNSHSQKSFHVTDFGAVEDKSFDVTKFGAVGDGENDDVKAFESAWKAACEAKMESVTITVPSDNKFLVSQIVFQGPCKPLKINFEILGTILAPPKEVWANKSAYEWLNFLHVDGLVVEGNFKGIIDGRGESWWNINGKHKSKRPTALRFHGCRNIKVNGLTHKNSPKNHVSLNYCKNADVANLMMQAPDQSPNTDGIDISSSTGLLIHDIIMETGDDCIAINGGTYNVHISNIMCGPGHGISIGSLGSNLKYEEISGIIISNCTLKRTRNGVRIKTWQGGSGFAKNIAFSNIKFIEADNPVIIDQYYCPHMECPEQPSAVKVRDVTYTGLHGTSVGEDGAIVLNCSRTVSCDNIVLKDVNIKPASSDIPNKATCINAKGQANTKNPVVDCMEN